MKQFFTSSIAKRLGSLIAILVIAVNFLVALILYPFYCYENCRLYSTAYNPEQSTVIEFKKDEQCFLNARTITLQNELIQYLRSLEVLSGSDNPFKNVVYTEFWPQCYNTARSSAYSVDPKGIYVTLAGQPVFGSSSTNLLNACEISNKIFKSRMLRDKIDVECNPILHNTLEKCTSYLNELLVYYYGEVDKSTKCASITATGETQPSLQSPFTISIDGKCILDLLISDINDSYSDYILSLLVSAGDYTKTQINNKLPNCQYDENGYFYEMFDSRELTKKKLYCTSHGCESICKFNDEFKNILQSKDEGTTSKNSAKKPYYCSSNDIHSCEIELLNRWSEFTSAEYFSTRDCMSLESKQLTSYTPFKKFNPQFFSNQESFLSTIFAKFILPISWYFSLIAFYLLIIHAYFLLLVNKLKEFFKKYIIKGDAD